MRHLSPYTISISSLILLLLNACSSTKPTGKIVDFNHISRPDYSDSGSWAALPIKKDSADLVPHPDLNDRQQEALIDVFFLHPTTYTGSKGQDQWNAPVDDAELNRKTDRGSIKNQASIFNGVGRVFAPRYRQAHIHSYFTEDTVKAKKAFALAYKDVKAAFEFYLQHYNEGRPIIIAGHSQGTTHAKKILKEYFDGKPLHNQLVAAYLVGMPVSIDNFENIEVCKNANQTGCFNSWRTWKKGHFPNDHKIDNSLAVTNPLSWTTSESYAPKALNKGSVLQKFEDSYYPGITDAQVQNGVLWITKPKFPGSMFVWFKNYHVADYNLFYTNVRENAQTRARNYLEQLPPSTGNTSQ